MSNGFHRTNVAHPYYDVSPDGKRFLMIRPSGQRASNADANHSGAELFEELKRRVPALIWPARIGAIAGSLLVSGGFFAVAHVRALRGLLYLGAAVVAATTLVVGIGLIRTP